MTTDSTEEAARDSSNPFIAETLRIAAAGEDRSRALDLVGWLIVIVAVTMTAVTVVVLLSVDEADRDEVGAVSVGFGLGGLLACFITAAVFFGFAALVRNSSRSLALQAIDSPLAD